ncbi:MAG: alpha/beta hydrolase [Ruthenibacterium lactatiformans]
MAEYARRFYDAGFSLLLPDARGHGQSEGGYIGMGWPERRDIAALVQRVTAENGAPDIVLMGVSMGAATVMMTAGEPLPPNVRAIVEDCGYTTAWEEFRYQLKKTYGLPPFPVLYTADALLRRRAGFSLREASAAAQVAHSRTPMLFIHGGRMPSFPLPCWMRCMRRRGVLRKNMWSRMQAMRSPCAWRPRAIGQSVRIIGRWMPLPGAERTVAADPAEKPV